MKFLVLLTVIGVLAIVFSPIGFPFQSDGNGGSKQRILITVRGCWAKMCVGVCVCVFVFFLRVILFLYRCASVFSVLPLCGVIVVSVCWVCVFFCLLSLCGFIVV